MFENICGDDKKQEVYKKSMPESNNLVKDKNNKTWC